MASAYPPIPTPQAERTEQLARLIHELLDAHTNTELLVGERRNALHWRVHLSYLGDLQRTGHAIWPKSSTQPTTHAAGAFDARNV